MIQSKLERNIDAEIMIKCKAERFDNFWNNFKYEYKRESNQKTMENSLLKRQKNIKTHCTY